MGTTHVIIDKSTGSNCAPSDNVGHRATLDSLSLNDRLDLLDLVAVVRGAEPRLTGAPSALGPLQKGAFAPIRHHSFGGLSHASPTSSAASLGPLPAISRLSELADEKLNEVYELQSRFDGVLSA